VSKFSSVGVSVTLKVQRMERERERERECETERVRFIYEPYRKIINIIFQNYRYLLILQCQMNHLLMEKLKIKTKMLSHKSSLKLPGKQWGKIV
jgi:hypothetical protein